MPVMDINNTTGNVESFLKEQQNIYTNPEERDSGLRRMTPLCKAILDETSFPNLCNDINPPLQSCGYNYTSKLEMSNSSVHDFIKQQDLKPENYLSLYGHQVTTSYTSSSDSRSIDCPIRCSVIQPTSISFHLASSAALDFVITTTSDETSVSHQPPVSTVKPSEALFVRALIGRCKRIAPLWFRGVSSMRERNREENRRMACNNGQSQNDWSLIALKIAEMNPISETDAVSNLLKKLYKELPSDSVLWFLKCWLGSEDTIRDPDLCVLSRGDAKGRMRRIDGGKGSDKVWRLDTIVGMLYHGLPMSSTDTNIMIHTCDQELCVRPQRLLGSA